MSFVLGVSTLMSMAVFFGIVWWAWSKGRMRENAEAANLPFTLPDEATSDSTIER